MRILLLNQFYPPDVAPTGRYLHDLAGELVKAGHDVVVWTSSRSYNGGGSYPREETIDGVLVQRTRTFGFGRANFLAKLADYALFYLMLFRRALMAGRGDGARFDAVVSLTTPPYIGLLGNLVARRCKAESIQWVMDLYPDVMAAHGMIRENFWYKNLLAPLTRWQFKNSDQIWALGPYQKKKILNYLEGLPVANIDGGTPYPSAGEQEDSEPSAQIIDIPLWRQAEAEKACETKSGDDTLAKLELDRVRRRMALGWDDDTLGIMYSGNMGLGHRFDAILEAVRHYDRLEKEGGAAPGGRKVRFAFVGGGKRKVEILAYIARYHLDNVVVEDYVAPELLAANLAAADVHFVSLDEQWKGLIVPSKLMNIMAVGRPVLFVGPCDSEIAQWISEANAGWSLENEDAAGLIEVIGHLASSPSEPRERGHSALLFAREKFSFENNTRRLIELLQHTAAENLALAAALETSIEASPSDISKSA